MAYFNARRTLIIRTMRASRPAIKRPVLRLRWNGQYTLPAYTRAAQASPLNTASITLPNLFIP